jgi:putative transposon-encoded protein
MPGRINKSERPTPPSNHIAGLADYREDKTPYSNIFRKVKFEVYGEEMMSKEVRQSGNSGRVYLPPDWIGRHVKVIRID